MRYLKEVHYIYIKWVMAFIYIFFNRDRFCAVDITEIAKK